MFKRATTKVWGFANRRNVHTAKKVGIIGAPFAKGQPKLGVDTGPTIIRETNLIRRIRDIDPEAVDVKDYGDVTYTNKQIDDLKNMKNYSEIVSFNEQLSKGVAQVLTDGRTCVTLGGDHSIALGSVDGHLQVKPNVALIWVDAHADINTNVTSSTGNVHGMPVALLAKELIDFWPKLPGLDWRIPKQSLQNIAYIGLRDVDVYERLIIDKFGMVAYSSQDVERYGIHDLTRMALKKIDPFGEKSIHVSFDIDSLDPLEAPSTGTPVRGGLTLREGVHLMEMLSHTGRLNCFDIVEVNPRLGNEIDRINTVEAALKIILAGLGSKARGNHTGIRDIPLQTSPPTRDRIHQSHQ